MIFIESLAFTEDLATLLSEESYGELQAFLAENPTAGDVIQGTNGLRKIRWAVQGKGGGVRVIYYHFCVAYQIRLILIYRKGIKDDLSPAEKRILSEINRRWE
ncbi:MULTISPECIES: hypothetical protein [unclassified Pseudomonas]|jgi:thiamine kinase-like enzyme|uniref:hypothetical protein n=1 Tax=unclassified Pseudomonas TaxID=196821 RepID=UPI000EE5EE85|nr:MULTISPECIES: hypothetical protein [unclassified Pseudomonas]MCS4246523.1 thiamine kinase-like enzyme [Pseudomonas sp. BIGb0164]NWE20136.1 hypothetical protein [Pseudomonas sp. P7548]HCT05418.1 hypothetical protein [Pseudomonas sp.]